MTFVEALRQSKEEADKLGSAQPGPAFHADGGWFRWFKGWTYKLSAEELLSDDYEFLPYEGPVDDS